MNNRKTINWMLLAFISLLVIFFSTNGFVKKINELNEIKEINLDSLSKYYQLFLINNSKEDFDKEDFIKFLSGKNEILKSQLTNKNIKLSSTKFSEKNNSFPGFYHIGFDNIDDKGKVIVPLNIKSCVFGKKGDLLITTNNYFGINRNKIYSYDKNRIIELGKFNARYILAKSLNCDSVVKMKLVLEEYKNELQYTNDSLSVKHAMDKRTLNILINDSSLIKFKNKFHNLYIDFDYYPISLFYCDSIANNRNN